VEWPLGVRAHFTRSMAYSKILAWGASLHDVCAATGWSSLDTFRFYSLDADSAPGSRILQGWSKFDLG